MLGVKAHFNELKVKMNIITIATICFPFGCACITALEQMLNYLLC